MSSGKTDMKRRNCYTDQDIYHENYKFGSTKSWIPNWTEKCSDQLNVNFGTYQCQENRGKALNVQFSCQRSVWKVSNSFLNFMSLSCCDLLWGNPLNQVWSWSESWAASSNFQPFTSWFTSSFRLQAKHKSYTSRTMTQPYDSGVHNT